MSRTKGLKVCLNSETYKNIFHVFRFTFRLLQRNVPLTIMSVMKLIVHPLPQTVCRCSKRKIHFFILFRSMMIAPGLHYDTGYFLGSSEAVIILSSTTWSVYTRSVRKVSDRIFLCEHLMDYNLARLHEPTLNLSAHA